MALPQLTPEQYTFVDTKANIEALTGLVGGERGYATDTGEKGHYDAVGAAWVWGSGGSGAVDSVNGQTGTVVLDYSDVGADASGSAATAETNAKSYADGLAVGLWDDRGSYDASSGSYPSSGGSGTAGAILKGDIWTISVAGTLPTGQVVEVGDVVRALVNTPGNTQANWAITQNNIGYVAENTANKATTMSGNTTSNIVFLTAKAIYDWAIALFSQLGHAHAASDITSGTMATARLGSGTANTGTFLSGDQTFKAAHSFIAKNTSGATANAGDVGYINEAGEYKTTTTAQDSLSWVVVIVGAANNSDIYVTNRGRININYTGTAPSTGHFLVTSTSAGVAQRQTTMHPAIFAVCLASGSGGVVSALLLTQTQFIPLTSSLMFYALYASSSQAWTGTINGTPTTTNVPYTVSAGNENSIGPNATTDLAKLRLYNITRGTSRLVTANNTGTNNITTLPSTDSWANGDSLTLASPTINDGLSPPFCEFDLSQQSIIPLLARAAVVSGLVTDVGGAGAAIQFHPYEAYGASKINIFLQSTQGANTISVPFVPLKLINQIFGLRTQAVGAGTLYNQMYLIGAFIACP